MNAAKLALVASVATIMMTAGAAAQTNMNSSTGASGDVSAATHCRDANGQVQLQAAMSGSGAGSGAATTGSATTGDAAGGATTGSATTGSATEPSSSAMNSGSTADGANVGTSAAAGADLPTC
ncbi:MAG TPA: hypothetical protein VNR39_21015 [Pseudolabrys sp.]|nr:hypothetical protein [Pseudolabrys sp.]